MTGTGVTNAVKTLRRGKGYPGAKINESGKALGRGSVRADAPNDHN